MPSAGPELRREVRRPRRDDAVDRRIELPFDAIGHGVAGDAAQRGDHVADRDEMPGTLTERVCANAAAGASWPTMMLAMTVRGDVTHIRVVRATGQIASTPDSGSRMMPLANDDAALFGLPGRTVTVGRRRLRPSMKPLRVMS